MPQCEATTQGIRCVLETGHIQPWSAAFIAGQRIILYHNYGGLGPYTPRVTPEPLRPGITAVLTAHPARLANGMLNEALASVTAQTLQPVAIVVCNDTERQGAAVTRQRALDMVTSRWVAFTDSDDVLYPNHYETLMRVADETGAVYVYSWMDGNDPLGHFGIPFDPRHPHHTTITVLCRTDIAKEVGFTESARVGTHGNEDWAFICGVSALAVERNLLMVHVPIRTWTYRSGGWNTSGIPGQGDAL